MKSNQNLKLMIFNYLFINFIINTKEFVFIILLSFYLFPIILFAFPLAFHDQIINISDFQYILIVISILHLYSFIHILLPHLDLIIISDFVFHF